MDALYFAMSTAHGEAAVSSNGLLNMIPLFKKHTEARTTHVIYLPKRPLRSGLMTNVKEHFFSFYET
jgi:hypothetical protein